MDRRLLAGILRSQGGKLLDLGLATLFAPPAAPSDETAPAPAKPKLAKRIAGAALLKLASRSVPGAIVVTGGMLAKAAHDRRKAKRTGKPPKSS